MDIWNYSCAFEKETYSIAWIFSKNTNMSCPSSLVFGNEKTQMFRCCLLCACHVDARWHLGIVHNIWHWAVPSIAWGVARGEPSGIKKVIIEREGGDFPWIFRENGGWNKITQGFITKLGNNDNSGDGGFYQLVIWMGEDGSPISPCLVSQNEDWIWAMNNGLGGKSGKMAQEIGYQLTQRRWSIDLILIGKPIPKWGYQQSNVIERSELSQPKYCTHFQSWDQKRKIRGRNSTSETIWNNQAHD